MKQLTPTYYKVMFGRKNQLKEKSLLFFLGLAPFFRMVPEVFLRKRMGRRYFNFGMAMFIGFVLAIAPIVYVNTTYYSPTWYDVIANNIAYYVFLAAYIFQCFMRRKDIKRIKSVFDFKEYTKSSGEIHPQLLKFEDANGDINFRLIETYIEPLIILLAGIVCLLFSMGLGLFLIFCAVVYCLSYSAQYYLGDAHIMDAIDKTIIGQELEGIMLNGYSQNGNRGVRYYGTRPSSQDLRQRLWNAMTSKRKDDEEADDSGFAL